MSLDQQHRCTVQLKADGSPYLAFEPSDRSVSSYSNSLFTLDLRPGASVTDAHHLAAEINGLVWGVSSTVF
jgi:hypothetical protein